MKYVLHIGPPKTGSTSIQRFINLNRKELDELGFFVPLTSNPNMREIFIAADDCQTLSPSKEKPKRAFSDLGITPENYPDRQLELREKIGSMLLHAKSAKYHTALLSSEGFPSLANKPGGLKALRKFLDQYASDYCIIPVLRRQDEAALSQYKNRLKNKGQQHKACLQKGALLNLKDLIQIWAEEFGENRVSPILFPGSVPEERDLIEDFCDAVGIQGIYCKTCKQRYRSNSAVDGRALETFRLLNIALPNEAGGLSSPGRRKLEKCIEAYFNEGEVSRVLPSRAEAQSFVAQYEAENEKIRRTYFPNRDSLFHGDFSKYPEQAVYPEPSRDDLIKILSNFASCSSSKHNKQRK